MTSFGHVLVSSIFLLGFARSQICFNPPCDNGASKSNSNINRGESTATSTGSKCPNGQTCQTFVSCAIYALDESFVGSTCTLGDGVQGTCCPDPSTLNVAHAPVEGGSSGTLNIFQPRARDPNTPQLEVRTLDLAAEEGRRTIELRNQQRREQLASGNVISPEDPRGATFRFHKPSDKAAKQAELAHLSLAASRKIQSDRAPAASPTPDGGSPSPGQTFEISQQDLRGGLRSTACPVRPACTSQRTSNFRTVDGSCNNPTDTLFGSSSTHCSRLLPSAYDDELFAPRTLSTVSTTPLPSARAISLAVFKSDERVADDDRASAGFVQWGQFIDHDLTRGAQEQINGRSPECCRNNGQHKATRELDEGCFPIDIPADDPFYSRFNQRCMQFVRTQPSPRLDCRLGNAEQINQLTHWLDGSCVYGSEEVEVRPLRTGSGGRMRTSPGTSGRAFLPRIDGRSFLAGDGRVNEFPGLTTMHTIFVREHNRIAAELEQLNGRLWDDERIYQETRKVIGALIQHITYNEFLPLSVGFRYMRNFGLLPLRSGFKRNYDVTINPQITNEFATAAFRYGHTKVPGRWNLFFGDNANPETLLLRNVFFEPNAVFNHSRSGNDGLDAFIRGFSRNPAESTDGAVTPELREMLFAGGRPFGMDLMALNIQRGRDHGLRPYNDYRDVCAIGKLKNWDDARRVFGNEITSGMQRVYQSVDDIDLFVGGSVEPLVPGTELGPTFLCIVGDQFGRLQRGDRFYYENGGEPHSFTEAQLSEIRRSSLARILCDNSAVRAIQPWVMAQVKIGNPLINCDDTQSIPRMNLSPWRWTPVTGFSA